MPRSPVRARRIFRDVLASDRIAPLCDACSKAVVESAFGSTSGEIVLAHLRRICFGEDTATPFSRDPLEMAANIGKLEVYKEIRRFLNFTDEELDAVAEREDRMGE